MRQGRLVAKAMEGMEQMTNNRGRQSNDEAAERGFTILEVTLAMFFVAFIVLILAAMTINIVKLYNKGVWLSQINQAGQQLNTDIGDKARFSTAAVVDESARRICVSGVTYMWNTRDDIEKNNVGNNVIDGTTDKNGYIRLVRVDDPGGYYCTDEGKDKKPPRDKARILLGRGASVEEFNVKQGVGGSESGKQVPLLTVETLFMTEGVNKPNKGSDGNWQCGEWEGDKFTEAPNQFCSFAHYKITVYERSRQRWLGVNNLD